MSWEIHASLILIPITIFLFASGYWFKAFHTVVELDPVRTPSRIKIIVDGHDLNGDGVDFVASLVIKTQFIGRASSLTGIGILVQYICQSFITAYPPVETLPWF